MPLKESHPSSIFSPQVSYPHPYVVNLSSVVRFNFSQRDRVQDQTIRNDEQMQPRLENGGENLASLALFSNENGNEKSP